MAALLLRQGRAGSLKTMLLEGRAFRGLAPTVSLSAESGKSDKGLPPNPKKQSAPKRVVEPKERGKLLTTPAAAASPKHSPAPRAPPSVVPHAVTVAGPRPNNSMQLAEAGVPSSLSKKTLVEFPQDVPSSFRKQGSSAEALQQGQRGAGGSSSPSSSSSSSSESSSSESESESDEEGAGSSVDSQGMHEGKRRVSEPGASRPFEAGAPPISIPAQEKSCSPQPHLDRTSAEKPHPARKKAASRKPFTDRKDVGPKPLAPQSPGDTEFVKQNVKESLQKRLRSNETGRESQEPPGVPVPPDRTRSGSCTPPSGGPMPPGQTQGTTVGQLLAASPGTRARPGREGASPPGREENSGEQVTEGILKAKEETLEDRVPTETWKPVPFHSQEVSPEQTAALKPGAKGQVTGDSASQAGEQDAAQEPAQATAPAEPFDNTTYKNLQHHDYTPYTFLDLNLDLSKFRLPQPSSGRESPRH